MGAYMNSHLIIFIKFQRSAGTVLSLSLLHQYLRPLATVDTDDSAIGGGQNPGT